MNSSIWIAALLGAISLTACDKPTVVNVPPPAPAVPGPAGPTGATGSTGSTGSTGAPGYDGSKGDPGKPGEGTTVIIVPGASAPAK